MAFITFMRHTHTSQYIVFALFLVMKFKPFLAFRLLWCQNNFGYLYMIKVRSNTPETRQIYRPSSGIMYPDLLQPAKFISVSQSFQVPRGSAQLGNPCVDKLVFVMTSVCLSVYILKV